jgi:hypothetical protein
MAKTKRVLGKNWFDCCEHCACREESRRGHEEKCPKGCNDLTKDQTVE